MKNCTPTLRMMGLLLMLCCSSSVFAQNWSYGVRAGFNASDGSVFNVFAKPANAIPSYHIGVFGQFYLYDELRLCPELTYTPKSVRVAGEAVTDNYLDLSLVAKLPLGEGSSYLTLGPFASFRLKENAILTQQQAFDLGGIFGYGYQITEQLGAELRLQFPANLWEKPATLGGGTYRLTSWSIGLTYLLPWGQ